MLACSRRGLGHLRPLGRALAPAAHRSLPEFARVGVFSLRPEDAGGVLGAEWLTVCGRRRAVDMPLPFSIIARREIVAEMDAARLFTLKSRVNHKARNRKQILQFPGSPVGELARQHITAPECGVVLRLLQARALADDPHVPNYH